MLQSSVYKRLRSYQVGPISEQELVRRANQMSARFELLQAFWRWSGWLVGLVLLVILSKNLVAPWRSATLDVTELATMTNAHAVPQAAKSQPQRWYIYARNQDDAPVLTSVDDLSALTMVWHEGGWQRVSLASGLPVWIRKNSIESIGGGLVRIAEDSALAFAGPNNSDVVGVVFLGDQLKRIRVDGDWVRVWSPVDFSAWIRAPHVDYVASVDLK